MAIRALVVDDSMPLRRSVMYALQRLELPDSELVCVEAQDGAEALKKLASGHFDIVITDINMPVLDGLKLIDHIRKDPAHQQVPIIVITTERAEEDKRRALALGANAYLMKPVQANEVLDKVKELLELE